MKIKRSELDDIVNENYAKILNYCTHKVGNENDASDLTQTVFTIFIERHATIELESASKWLINTASHKVSDYHRKRYNARKNVADVEPYDDMFVDNEDFYEYQNSKDFELVVEAVYARLSEVEKELCIDITMYNGHRMTYEEMAAKYNCTVTTMRKRVSRVSQKVHCMANEFFYIFIVLMKS